jgi:predicted transcriptional regulator
LEFLKSGISYVQENSGAAKRRKRLEIKIDLLKEKKEIKLF